MNAVKQKIKKVYHQNKLDKCVSVRLAVSFIRKLKYVFKELNAFNNLIILKLNYTKKHHRSSDKINIVFLYQMPQVWNKLDSVCKELMKNEKFNVIILAIPKVNTNTKSGENRYLNNEALKAAANFNCKVIDAKINDNEWYDLKSLNPDYVFYQRPYDSLLPDIYKSYNTIKYTKTCYIPYGWLTTANFEQTCLNREFFRNLYLFYAENKETCNIIKKETPVSNALNLRKTLSLGYPSLDLVGRLKKSESTSWTRNREVDKLRIIWTPRWTTDANLGGSNFFKYKDKFIEFAKENEEIYVLFRPHPLAFENYLNTGLMSQDEIDHYKNNFEQLPNASIDIGKSYVTTFWNSDILVTDISSIIIEYFLTGKPIIYCNSTVKLNEFTMKMSKGFYWADSWDEIESIILKIKHNEDWLYDKRQELIKELFGDNVNNSSSRIVESILKDYRY